MFSTSRKLWAKIPVRCFQYLLYFFTLVIYFGIFSSLSVAIVSMTGEAPSPEEVKQHVEWKNPDTILSAFFWAYFIPNISGAKLSQFVGPKWLLLMSMFISCVFNIVVPVMADGYGSTGVIICRVFQGLCQGFIYPSIDNLIKVWAPQKEKARVSNIVYNGAVLGTAVCMPVAGQLAGSKNGWPVVFYVFGSVGIIWGIIFATFSEHSPSTHNGISVEEQQYIEERSVPEEGCVAEEPQRETGQSKSAPWLSIVKSKPIWAILVAGSAQCWGTYTLLTQIPTYMSTIMNFDLSEDGELAGVPYFVQLGVNFLVLPITVKLMSTQSSNTTLIRKISNSLGSFIPMTALIVLAFVDSTEKDAAVALLVLAVSMSVFGQTTYLSNVVDLTPNHAPVVQSVVHTTTTVFSALGPLSVGLLGTDKKDPELWKKMFLIAAAIYFLSGIFYAVFASAEVESWNFDTGVGLEAGVKIKDFFKKWYSWLKEKFSCCSCCGNLHCSCLSWTSIKNRFDCISI